MASKSDEKVKKSLTSGSDPGTFADLILCVCGGGEGGDIKMEHLCQN